MARFVLSRRTVLRGAGGLSVALPALEIMSRAHAATAPKRFVMAYAGSSLGTEREAKMGAAGLVLPSSVGFDYQPTPAVQPLTDLRLKSEVTIVSGLKIPWGSTPPSPAGRVVNFHAFTTVPQTTGTKASKTIGTTSSSGPSADQIVAERVAQSTLHKSLVVKVQPVDYLGGGGAFKGRISFDRAGRRVEPTGSPTSVYEAMFAGLRAPTQATPAGGVAPAPTASRPALDLLRRKSVIDFVKGETERLLPRLGRGDRQRLEQHFAFVRDIERQIALLSMNASGAAAGAAATSKCEKPAELAEPPLLSNSKGGYNDEDLRARLMTNLIHMALACDSTRVVSLLYTYAQCFMGCRKILPSQNGSDLHEIGHGAGSLADQHAIIAWHVRHWGNLVAALRDTEDVDGRKLLDNTALVLLFEGGWGADPESNRTWSAHSTERMAVLIAGRAGGLKHKGHLVAQDRHPAEVLYTAMKAVGVSDPLGEISTGISELFA